MQAVDRPGIFRAKITGYGLAAVDSGAVGVNIKAHLTESWMADEKVWEPWEAFEQEAEGTIWIIKKNGDVNEHGANSLIQCAGWDGNVESIESELWQPTPVQVVVQTDTYKDKTRFRIAFVNDFNRTPGMISSIGADKAREIQNQYGSQFRALAGNARRSSPPNGNMPLPTLGGPPPAPVDADKDIPF